MNGIDLLNLNSSQGFRILGAEARDLTGCSVSGVGGDVNGDGINDVVVGAYNATASGRTWAGVVYVIYGSSSGLTDLDLVNFTPVQGFKILGEAAYDWLGTSVSGAGDINSDGFNDVIIGAYSTSPNGRINAGTAYVIYGKGGLLANIDLANLTSAQGFKILGAADHDSTGSVSTAGDIDGDGVDDVIVGAIYASPNGRTQAGTVYVIYGNSGGLTDIDLATFTSAQGFKILGAVRADRTGSSVSAIGDINGDGINDVIVGAVDASPMGRSRAGIAYVIYGKNGGLDDIDLSTFTLAQGFRILGAVDRDYTGCSVSGAGDINGDAISDLVVGAWNASPSGRTQAGEAYVVYGNSGSMTDIDLANLTVEQGFKILGAAANDRTGWSVSSAGDINGDGLNDVIIGAQYASAIGRARAGTVYVIYGKSGGLADIDLATLTSAQGFEILGAAAADATGISVSVADDINGDGLDDVILGAYYAYPNGRVIAGTAYVIYGNNDSSITNSPTSAPITMVPTDVPTSFPTVSPTSMPIEDDPASYNMLVGASVEQED